MLLSETPETQFSFEVCGFNNANENSKSYKPTKIKVLTALRSSSMLRRNAVLALGCVSRASCSSGGVGAASISGIRD